MNCMKPSSLKVTTQMTKDEIKNKITDIFKTLFPAATSAELDLVPKSLTDGKLYEAFIVAVLSAKLVIEESLDLTLVNGNHVQLKSSPGPINRDYPYIQVSRAGSTVAELWTDIEYLTLSFAMSSRMLPNKGDYHELDIVVVDPGPSGRPPHDKIWLGVECKNVEYRKGLLKEILGVRRELSLLQNERETRFNTWPRQTVPAEPAPCLLVYSSKTEVLEYSDPGNAFGIDFFHEPLPD